MPVSLLVSDIIQNKLSQAKTYCGGQVHSEMEILDVNVFRLWKQKTLSPELVSLFMQKVYPSFEAALDFCSSTVQRYTTKLGLIVLIITSRWCS